LFPSGGNAAPTHYSAWEKHVDSAAAPILGDRSHDYPGEKRMAVDSILKRDL
jgi:hypothetical protein